jgi:hypothetical protein
MIRYAVMYVLAHVKRSWVHVEVVEESALKLATTHSQKCQCVYKLYTAHKCIHSSGRRRIAGACTHTIGRTEFKLSRSPNTFRKKR